MKRILCFVIMIFSLFCFSGCSNKKDFSLENDFIIFSTQFSSKGELIQTINFSVNYDKIDEISSKNEEKIGFLSKLIENVDEIRNDFLFSFALKYMKDPKEEFKINQGVFLSKVCYYAETDTVGFKIIYNSLESFNYYHSNVKEESANEKRGNIFYKKTQSKSKFLFSSKDEMGISVGEKYRQKYIASANGMSFENKIKEEYKPQFIYDYITQYRSIKSNSTYKFEENQTYHHIWQVKYENLDDENEIIIGFSTIYYGTWYLAALMIVVLPLFLSLLIYYLKTNHNGKRDK